MCYVLIKKNLGQVVSTKKKKLNRVQKTTLKRYLSFGMNGVKVLLIFVYYLSYLCEVNTDLSLKDCVCSSPV